MKTTFSSKPKLLRCAGVSINFIVLRKVSGWLLVPYGVNAAASYFLPLRFFKILAFSDFVLNFMSAVIELVRFSNFDNPFVVQCFFVFLFFFNDESRRVLNYKGFDFLYIMETFRP